MTLYWRLEVSPGDLLPEDREIIAELIKSGLWEGAIKQKEMKEGKENDEKRR